MLKETRTLQNMMKAIDTFPRRKKCHHKTQKFAFNFRWFTNLWFRERRKRIKFWRNSNNRVKWERD